MKIHNSKITKLTALAQTKRAEQLLNKKPVYVFPFRLVLGITNLTNNGERDWKAQVSDYNSFLMVLNGKENAVAVWEGSTRAFKDALSDNPLKGFKAEYKVGKYLNGYLNMDTMGASTDYLNIDDSFKTLKHTQLISVVFDKTTFNNGLEMVWDITPQDLYKLYIIPELYANQWLYIVDVKKYYSNDKNKKLNRVEVFFKTLGDELSDTAGVKRQFINYGSAGEGYAFPVVDSNRNISLNEARLKDTPITSVQIRCDGIAAINSFYFFGRPCFDNPEIAKNSNKRILPPRRILPQAFTSPIMPKLSLNTTATDAFYISPKSEMVLDEIYNDWRANIGDTYNLLQTQNFEGGVYLGQNTDIAKIEQTNTLANGIYSNNIKDNPIIKYADALEYDGFASPYLELEERKFKYKAQTPLSCTQWLAAQGFIQDQILRLKNTNRSITTWSINRLPIIGGYLNGIVQGADWGWNQINILLPSPPFAVFFPCELLNLAKLAGGEGKINSLPCDYFRMNTESDLTQKAGIGNLSTTMRVYISDVFSQNFDDRGNFTGPYYETLLLGQRKNADGSPINIKWTKTSGAIPLNYLDVSRGKCYGYIIDYINIKMLYEGDYTITFFNDFVKEQPVAVAEWRLLSKGKATRSIREWNNEFLLSYWSPNFTTEGTFKWPEAVQFPAPTEADIAGDLLFSVDAQVKGGVHSTTQNLGTTKPKQGAYFDDWNKNVSAQEIEQYLTLYFAEWIGTEWDKDVLLHETRNYYYKDSRNYQPRKKTYSTERISINSSQVLEWVNNAVKVSQVLDDIAKLKKHFKRVKIGAKLIFEGQIANHNSTAGDYTYLSFDLSIDEFLGSYTKLYKIRQDTTFFRHQAWYTVLFVPNSRQIAPCCIFEGGLQVNNGNITLSGSITFYMIYPVISDGARIYNNNTKFYFKLDKLEFLKE